MPVMRKEQKTVSQWNIRIITQETHLRLYHINCIDKLSQIKPEIRKSLKTILMKVSQCLLCSRLGLILKKKTSPEETQQ